MMITVRFMRAPGSEGLPLPEYATALASGMDLLASIETPVRICHSESAVIPVGLMVAIPEGYEAQIRPRSGLAIKHGITVLNSPGTIDADYRGELKVALMNLSHRYFTVTRGMKIAQLVFAPVVKAVLIEAGSLPETGRGSGGFGSTGD